jgi:hypothetical protein
VLSTEAVLHTRGDLFSARVIYVGHDEFCSYFRQTFTAGPADTAGAAGDDSNLIFQVQPAHLVDFSNYTLPGSEFPPLGSQTVIVELLTRAKPEISIVSTI